MDDEDEFETHFRRAVERAPIKQLSQQYIPTAKTPTTRRASLQAPDAMYSIQMASMSKQRSLSPSSDISHETRRITTPISPMPHSARRRSGKSPSDEMDRRRESSSSSSTAASTTSVWLARHFNQSYSAGSSSRRHRRSQLKSIVSSPGEVIHRSESRSPPVGPKTARQGRRATLAGDLLQIPPTFSGYEMVDRRSSSVSPPSTSPCPSPGTRQQCPPRCRMDLSQASAAITADRRLQQAVAGYRTGSSPVEVGARSGHLVRSFLVTAKGVINVENAVRYEENVFYDDAVEMRTGRAVRPTALRQTSSKRRDSTTADHSPRLSPQRIVAASAAVSAAAVCGEISVNLSSRRRRSEQLESIEYKVLVVGDHGVGKTELICHFTTSYAATSTSAVDEDDVKSVTVAVDGQETRLVFVEYSSFLSPHMAPENDVIKQADAYVVIYSMTDRSSYQWAYSFIDDVTQTRSDVSSDDAKRANFRSQSTDVVVILVANKSDLVRKRQVSTEEAADACQLRRCKYTEVSAALGHRVDELLVGIAKQIQLMAHRHGSSARQPLTGATAAASVGADNARSPLPLWSTVGRIKAATRFVIRGLLGKPPSSCSDLMKP